ncbi:MAG: cyclase family protein [Rhodopila sp.]
MKLTRIIVQAALGAVLAASLGSGAFAQADYKTLIKPSPFGADDQTGATNRITAAVTKAAASEIQTGETISMTNMLVDGVPLFGTRFTKNVLTATSLVPGAEYGKNKLTYMEDTWLSQSHVGTHLDGLGHIGLQDCYYNQTPMGKYVTQNGLKRLGLENLKSFATRGVIIDAVRAFREAGKLKKNPNCKGDCLDGGTVISAADLQAGLKMYNVTLREGDAVFIHTGWEDLFLQYPAMNAVYNGSEPGIGKDAGEWLAQQKVILVGTDTWAVEVIPSEDPNEAFPVHANLLANNGIHIIENVRTDLIAADAQRTGRATFFLNLTVPKAVGFTGNFVSVEAIR